jgi:hypothetical protein
VKRALVLALLLMPVAAQPCGTERWAAKVLSDAAASQLNLTPKTITVAGINALPKECSKTAADRTGLELQLHRLTAKVKLIKHEDDGDLHIVLEDAAGRTLVVESPSQACAAHSHFRTVLKAARAACDQLHVGQTVTIQAPVFYDFFHKQTGMSKSCAELHPIMWVK